MLLFWDLPSRTTGHQNNPNIASNKHVVRVSQIIFSPFMLGDILFKILLEFKKQCFYA